MQRYDNVIWCKFRQNTRFYNNKLPIDINELILGPDLMRSHLNIRTLLAAKLESCQEVEGHKCLKKVRAKTTNSLTSALSWISVRNVSCFLFWEPPLTLASSRSSSVSFEHDTTTSDCPSLLPAGLRFTKIAEVDLFWSSATSLSLLLPLEISAEAFH